MPLDNCLPASVVSGRVEEDAPQDDWLLLGELASWHQRKHFRNNENEVAVGAFGSCLAHTYYRRGMILNSSLQLLDTRITKEVLMGVRKEQKREGRAKA